MAMSSRTTSGCHVIALFSASWPPSASMYVTASPSVAVKRLRMARRVAALSSAKRTDLGTSPPPELNSIASLGLPYSVLRTVRGEFLYCGPTFLPRAEALLGRRRGFLAEKRDLEKCAGEM